MLRIVSKLNVKRLLREQPLVQFCTVKVSDNSEHSNELEQWQSLDSYYKGSGRHLMFRNDSEFVYQFDKETRNLTPWECSDAKQKMEWDEVTRDYNNDQLIRAFECLLNYSLGCDIPLTDTRFDQFIDDFCKRMQSFTLNELIRALQIFAKYPLPFKLNDRNYIELFYAFDQACTIQSVDLLPSQLLFISSIWLAIPSAKRSYFSKLIPRLFNRYMRNMNAPELAQATFFINYMDKPIEDIRAFENIFERVLNDLTIEEFTTILWTFIRCETKIEKRELLFKYFDYLEKHDPSQLNDSQLSKLLVVSFEILLFFFVQTNRFHKQINFNKFSR